MTGRVRPWRVPSDRKRRLTRRGHYLVTFGLVQVALGLAYLSPPVTEGGRLAAQLLPPAAYTTASVAVGLLAAVAAFVRPSLERPAFVGLAVLATARAASLAAVFVLGDHNAALLTGVLAFALLTRVHVLVSGWPDPPLIVEPVHLTQGQLEALADYLRRHSESED